MRFRFKASNHPVLSLFLDLAWYLLTGILGVAVVIILAAALSGCVDSVTNNTSSGGNSDQGQDQVQGEAQDAPLNQLSPGGNAELDPET